MLRLVDVEKVYRGDGLDTVALHRINLQVGNGEFVSIMGPSGCGKSTLLNLLGLLDTPTGGAMYLEDEPVHARGDRALSLLRNRTFGFVFQSYHLVPDLTVQDNVELPLLYRSTSGRERRRLALAALERVGMSSRTRNFPGQLSGGQQQRVAIARAIVGAPRVLLADEPAGNLDSQMGDEILALLGELNRDEATTIVMVTHDARHAAKTHRIVRLLDGRQVA